MLVLWATAGIAAAQTAALSGAVYDPSHAGIFNAAVTLVNTGTGSARVTVTSADGLYSFALLAPGSYSVTVDARGFRKAARHDVPLDVAESARLDFTLELAATGESVTVSADASPVRSDSAAVSTVIDRQLIDTLPLNGRSFQTLIALTPGVVMTKASFGEQGQFSVNGQRANANYFTIDGLGANIGVSAGLTLVQSASGSLPGL